MASDNEPPELDEVDFALIAELQADAKLSFNKLGERVGLRAPSVMERIRKLEQGGIIRGYHALIDARKIGIDITAFLGVFIRNPKTLPHVEQSIEAEPEVLECHHVTGEYTLMLKVKCENTAALEKLISRLRALEGIERTETMVVLSTSTERARVPLEAGERTASERGASRRGGGRRKR